MSTRADAPLSPEHADARRAGELTRDGALLTGPRPPRPSALAATAAFGWRGVLKIKHVPEQLIDATITPVLFLLMFTYLFGGALAGSTGAYLAFLLPGALAQSVLFTSVYSGVVLNTDLTRGTVDRFRSLPIWRPAPLVGAVVGDTVRSALAATIVVVLGLVLGYRPDAGVPGTLAAMALVLAFAFGSSWVFMVLGLLLRSPSATMNAGFMLLFPLVFVSNAFVDPTTMPGWLHAAVDVNPVSHLVTAARGLMGDGASLGDVGLVLGEIAAVVGIFAPLTVRLYRGRE